MTDTGSPARLQLQGITKSYSGVVANDNIVLTVRPGSIHAILGENGAGKTTLMKVIYGVVRSDAGTIMWEGRPVEIGSPASARELGIGMVFQHFSLFPALTVLENLIVALPNKMSSKAIADAARELASRYNLGIDLGRTVHSLSVGERQRVEIVRCLLQHPRLVILDEPTSVLTPRTIAELFRLLKSLAATGCSILYISHKLHEVIEICDEVTVLRRGQVVAHGDPRDHSVASLAELMIGDVTSPPRRVGTPPATQARLSVTGLSRPAERVGAVGLNNVSFTIHGGEILGLAGIAGNGQIELLEALSGEWVDGTGDWIAIDGVSVARLGPLERRRHGLVYIPEERLGHGAVPAMSLSLNALLTAAHRGLAKGSFIDANATERFTRALMQTFDVRGGGPETEARNLSGGNLQKFIVGRELSQSPGIVIAHQPTWGVDYKAAAAVREALLAARQEGAAVLLVSEDLDEMLDICDSIAVISTGKLSPARPTGETSVEEIGSWMSGSESGSRKPESHALQA